MNITNDDLEVMIKMEHLLFSESNKTMFRDLKERGKCYFNDEEITIDDLSKYYNLIDKLIIKRKEKNIINTKKIAERRKLDPYYGRSKAEKERMIRAKAKKEMK